MAFLLFTPIRATKPINNAQMGGTSQEVVVMQINAKWNKHHNIDLKELKGCKVEFGWLEDQPQSLQSQVKTVPIVDQPQSLQSQVKTVPIVVVFKNGTPVKQWNADLSFTLDVDLSEIQSVVNTL
jgi:hypothetical protein